MIYYAESSFLFSFFGDDKHSARADRWMSKCKHWPLIVTRLGVFEFENSLRTAMINHRITADEQNDSIQRFRRALHEGFIQRREVPVAQWFPQAHRISTFSEEPRGFGALDILHVSAALYLEADGFLSFDEPQIILAKSEGFKTEP